VEPLLVQGTGFGGPLTELRRGGFLLAGIGASSVLQEQHDSACAGIVPALSYNFAADYTIGHYIIFV
jgi:hypothetical protein